MVQAEWYSEIWDQGGMLKVWSVLRWEIAIYHVLKSIVNKLSRLYMVYHFITEPGVA